MNRTLLIATLAASLVATRLTLGQGRSADAPGHNKNDDSSEGVEQVPDSSVDRVEDHGHRAHTNHVVFLRGKAPLRRRAGRTEQDTYPATDRARAYNLPSRAASGTIAIVDAYDYPTALADFNRFSNQFGLLSGAVDKRRRGDKSACSKSCMRQRATRSRPVTAGGIRKRRSTSSGRTRWRRREDRARRSGQQLVRRSLPGRRRWRTSLTNVAKCP